MEPPRADGLRVIRMVLGVLVVAVVALAVLVAVAFSTIQRSRSEAIIRSCQESNLRHDNTIAEYDRGLLARLANESIDAGLGHRVIEQRLHAEIASLPHDKQTEVEQSVAFFRLLVDRLSPKSDCTSRAARLTK